jgi:hypothetical protein
MLSTERPSALRLWGFVCTALGGLLIALGSLLTWSSSSLGPKIQGIDTKGIDTIEGKIVLAIGVAVLLAIVALRMSTSVGVRRGIAIGVIVGSLVAAGLTAWDIVAKDDRLGLPAASDEAALIARQTHLPEDVLREQLEKLAFVSLQPGIYVPLAGAVLGVVGGALGLAWAGREGARPSGGSAHGAEPTDGAIPANGGEPAEPSFPLPPKRD